MKPGNKNALFLLCGCTFMLVPILAKPLGIPDLWQFLALAAMFVCLLFFYLGDRKLKRIRLEREKAGEVRALAPPAQREKAFWWVAASFIAGFFIFLPLMPYTVENFWPGLYFYVIPMEVITIGGLLLYLRKKVFKL